MQSVRKKPWMIGVTLAIVLLFAGGANQAATAATTVQVGDVTVQVTTAPGTTTAEIDFGTILQTAKAAAKLMGAVGGWFGGDSDAGDSGGSSDGGGNSNNCNVTVNINGGTQGGDVNITNLNCGGSQNGNGSGGSTKQ